jgi:hypothetical protein
MFFSISYRVSIAIVYINEYTSTLLVPNYWTEFVTYGIQLLTLNPTSSLSICVGTNRRFLARLVVPTRE